MDYFSELLDSYNKLKKRTFKLTYINEQAENPAFQELRQILMQASEIESPIQSEQYPGLSNFKYKKTKNGGVTVLTGHTQMTILDPQGNLETLNAKGKPLNKKAQDEILNALYDAMRGEVDKKNENPELKADELVRQQQAAVEQQQEAAAAEPGAQLTNIGADTATLENIKSDAEYAKGMLGSTWFKNDKNLSQKYNQQTILPFITANNPESFEYKLANGIGLVDDGQGNLVEGQLNPSLLHAVTESNNALMSYLSDDVSENSCDTVEDRVGYYNSESDGRIVLFGATRNEGVVIRPNALQKIALERLQQNRNCSELGTTLEVVKSGVIENKYLNDLKGKFAEQVLSLVSNLSSGDPVRAAEAKKTFAVFVKRKRRQLEKLVSFIEQRGNLATDIETANMGQANQEMFNLLSDITSPKFRAFFKSVMRSMIKVKDIARPDYAEHTGTEVYSGEFADTGKKGDNVFVYTDEVRARRFADQFGIKVSKVIDPKNSTPDQMRFLYKVAVSQKFTQSIEEGKPGEIGSVASMRANYTGENPNSVDINQQINEKLFNSPQEEMESLNYFNDLEDQVQKKRALLVEDQVLVTVEGKIKVQSAEKTCKDIAKILLDKSGYKITDKELNSLLKDKEGKIKDFKHDQLRQRLGEFIARRERLNILKRDIQDPKKAVLAAKTLAKMSGFCGYSKDSAVTFHTDERENLLAYDSNAMFNSLFDELKQGTFNPSTQLKFSGSQVKFVTNAGELTFKFEGTDGAVRDTKYSVKIPSATVRSIDRLKLPFVSGKKVKPSNEDILYKFLEGQKELLETLLKITR